MPFHNRLRVQPRLRRFLSRFRYPRSKLSKPSPKRQSPDLDPPHAFPELPPELWLLILRFAASSPRTLSFSPSHSPHAISFLDFPHAHSNFEIRSAQYQCSVRQKLLFTHVCKSWHVYAQELLLEFIWISKASQASALAAMLALTPRNGLYILRLHIETPTLERCRPEDIMTIFANAPRLVVFSDYRSIRRPSPASHNPPELLDVLAQPGTGNSLRRLSWTNYSTLEGDAEDNVSFCLRMSPVLTNAGIAANLEFLELTFCSTHLQSIYPPRMRSSRPTSTLSSFSSDCPNLAFTESSSITLSLPALRSLKVTLDNATFLVLATWDMPLLAHLSVLSSDFSYSLHPSSSSSPSGFAQFFITHGAKLTELELGHSTATIEEYYLTTPAGAQPGTSNHAHDQGGLSVWCPNLTQFICSADAEWNWQNPDWIAPHVLLPSHRTIQFIGIRDLDKRLKDDMDLALAFRRGGGEEVVGDGDEHGREFFMLLEQIGSMLRREAFPSLKCIRDMSWGSHLMRKGKGFGDGRVSVQPKLTPFKRPGSSSSLSSIMGLSNPLKLNPMASISSVTTTRSSLSSETRKRTSTPASEHEVVALGLETKKILWFWKSVLGRCAVGDVCVEDWRGREVSMADLKRVEEGNGVVAGVV